jgi:hypothetical protein
MALSATLSINDGQATPVAHSFSATSVEALGTTRIDTGTTIVEPGLMVIKHSSSGKSPNQLDRHLVQFTTVRKDALGIPYTLTTNLTIAAPRQTVVTRAMINDHIAFVRNFLNVTANVDALLRNES